MAELKRYLNWCQPTHGHEMTEDSEGPWVAYEDYERLRADCARFITANTEVGALNVEQAETIARLRAALERITECTEHRDGGEGIQVIAGSSREFWYAIIAAKELTHWRPADETIPAPAGLNEVFALQRAADNLVRGETPALHLPPDGIRDGDGTWRGGKWYPDGPEQHAQVANDPLRAEYERGRRDGIEIGRNAALSPPPKPPAGFDPEPSMFPDRPAVKTTPSTGD